MNIFDHKIYFDAKGVCNHCIEYGTITRQQWFANEKGAVRWVFYVEQIKAAGHRRGFDCILGLSGGVDSSRLVIKIHERSFRPLAVYADAGWSSGSAIINTKLPFWEVQCRSLKNLQNILTRINGRYIQLQT